MVRYLPFMKTGLCRMVAAEQIPWADSGCTRGHHVSRVAEKVAYTRCVIATTSQS